MVEFFIEITDNSDVKPKALNRLLRWKLKCFLKDWFFDNKLTELLKFSINIIRCCRVTWQEAR